jgi:hypothetical protein
MDWHGWLWSRGRWERVCEAIDLGQCARELGRIADRRGIPTRWQVMTGGAPPTFRPAGEHRAEMQPSTRRPPREQY